MANLRFLWNNLIDVADLSASSEDPDYPIENVANELFLKAWRSTGIDESICVDLSASGITNRSVRAFVLKYHNLDLVSGDDYSIQASDLDLCGSLDPASGDLDDPFTPTDDVVIGFFDTAQIFDYWRFILSSVASKASGDYQRIGRIFLGDYFEPAYDISIPPEVVEVDESEILSTRQGQDYANVVTPYEIVTYYWKALRSADIARMKEIYQEVGKHKPFFICEDADQSGGAHLVTRYVKNVESWTFSPVVNGWGSVMIRVKTER
jgi:hypothetical protein